MAILVADKAKWEKAIEKCKAEKPRVKALEEFGKYEVCGKGGCYIVSWNGKGQSMTATCTCPAGAKQKPCYHIPATSGAWKLAVQTRAAARSLPVYQFDCPKCGNLFETENPVAFFCRNCEIAEQIIKDSTDLFGAA